MKKRLALLTAVSLFMAQGAVYAAAIGAGGNLAVPAGQPAAGSSITKLSNNVVGAVISNQNAFSAITKHINGTKNYATATSETKLYWADVTSTNKGTATFEITLTNSDTTDFAGWTSL